MLSNCCSSNLTRKNLLNNVGSLTWYKPFSCDTTNSESDIPQEREHDAKWHPVEAR